MLTKNSHKCFAAEDVYHCSSSRSFTVFELYVAILNRIRISMFEDVSYVTSGSSFIGISSP